MDFESSAKIFVACHKGLTPWLTRELHELGYSGAPAGRHGVELRGTLGDCIRLNLNLRCASQVLYSLASFRCIGPDQLYREVSRIRWESILPCEGYFSVTSFVQHPTIRSSIFANLRVKDAIVDRMRRTVRARPDCGSELIGAVVHLFWNGPRAEIFLDTSGPTIAKHGYRKHPGAAPMMESLAAGTLLATRWDRYTPLVNPMCGSGTIAIEAALLATDRRPGLFRKNYAFQHLLGNWEERYRREFESIRQKVQPQVCPRIIATDHDLRAVQIATENAAAAEIASLIEFSVCDFRETPLPSSGSVTVYFNPEYGERLGQGEALQSTYSAIGDFLKQRCRSGWGYVFTGNLELAKRIGLRTSRRLEFHTANLQCRLLEFELYAGSRRQPTDRDNLDNRVFHNEPLDEP